MVFAVSVLLMGGGVFLSLSNVASWGWMFGTGAFFMLIVCCMASDNKQ
jgi:hypothetical protein